MALYWVSYDLDKPGQDYSDLINRLKQYTAQEVTRSDWLVASDWTPAQVRDDLLAYLDNNDRIIVAELKYNAAWKNLLIPSDAVLKLFNDYATR
jgi:hypothetical protein